MSVPRKTAAKPVQAGRGNLSKPEITKLLMQAQEAFQYQTALGQIEPGERFDDWRRDQVMAAVGLPGISKIFRVHFRQVFAHFLTLCGRDDEAFQALTTTGSKRDHGPASDTHETAEALVHHIRAALAGHASAALPEGFSHLSAGWLLAAARQRTRKPSLTLETLAERLEPATLTGLLSHLRNHISRREGREISARRAPRFYPSAPPQMTRFNSSRFLICLTIRPILAGFSITGDPVDFGRFYPAKLRSLGLFRAFFVCFGFSTLP